MILSNYFDAVEVFNLIEKLREKDLTEDAYEQILRQLEQKLLLFKCPSCGVPIGAEISRKDWEKTWVDLWGASIRESLGVGVCHE